MLESSQVETWPTRPMPTALVHPSQ